MEFKLFKVSGYEEAIMSLRMSKGKYYSWGNALDIQRLVYAVTDQQGFIASEEEYSAKMEILGGAPGKLTGDYETDVAEFERLLQLTFKAAMEDKHHTLMKYIDISFFTEGLHRGAQDDLDAHAIAFNNRITRFSTRLAEIDNVKLSEWYQDKVIPIYEVMKRLGVLENHLPAEVFMGHNETKFILTPFGYVLEKFAQVPAKNGLAKDVQRGLMPLGIASNALWKIDFFNLRYVYSMRSKLTKANPELKLGMEQLADQIELLVPVFGSYFRKVFTDSGHWEHVNKVRTITSEQYQQIKPVLGHS
ncbi:FAD-dependent thymidylate synthase [Neobacillus sp. NPDC093127]|uniref:FAD-dependent thymidylate synthase n=1 Tax=Neobacillus sp. NPDC093127 TaxID=3364296 RepID=UPI003819F64E